MKVQFRLSNLLLATVAAGAWIGVYSANQPLVWSWHARLTLRDKQPITSLTLCGTDGIVTATVDEVCLWTMEGERESSTYTRSPVESLSCAGKEVGITILENDGMVHLWNPFTRRDKTYNAARAGEILTFACWTREYLQLQSMNQANTFHYLRIIQPDIGMKMVETVQDMSKPAGLVMCCLPPSPSDMPPGKFICFTRSDEHVTILPDGSASVWKRVDENSWIRQKRSPITWAAILSTVVLAASLLFSYHARLR